MTGAQTQLVHKQYCSAYLRRGGHTSAYCADWGARRVAEPGPRGGPLAGLLAIGGGFASVGVRGWGGAGFCGLFAAYFSFIVIMNSIQIMVNSIEVMKKSLPGTMVPQVLALDG